MIRSIEICECQFDIAALIGSFFVMPLISCFTKQPKKDNIERAFKELKYGGFMAEIKIVQKLDDKLIENKIISKQYKADYLLVHKKLNSLMKKTGRILSEDTFAKGELALRKWLLMLQKQGASQEKLTSYLRCGLAHLSFDFIESTYKQIDSDDLIARTLVSLKKRKFHNTFFKAPVEKKIKAVKKKKTAVKKTVKTIKKTKIVKSAKKPKKLKAIKKSKTPKKKTTAKKKSKSLFGRIKKMLD